MVGFSREMHMTPTHKHDVPTTLDEMEQWIIRVTPLRHKVITPVVHETMSQA